MEVPVGARAVIVLDIFKVQTSCGYGVPLLSETEQKGLLDRDTLGHWAGKTVSENKMVDYRAKNNAYSLDDLPGLKAGRRTRGERLWIGDARAYLVRLWHQMDAIVIGFVLAFVFIDLLFMSGVRINGVFADWS
ncbi:pyridoxamine phosphate oxidase family protein [Aureobasidium subglaciale]|nr:pyridoxamine phosphate oxidase family protein [Aureobasidium subglaciale]KAI5265060.1 pyridoxamine phosphate oxidase family protein [Aureobasidium subglaciale]